MDKNKKLRVPEHSSYTTKGINENKRGKKNIYINKHWKKFTEKENKILLIC